MKKNQDQIDAFLGKDAEFEGKLTFSGVVRIDGHLKGEILTDGKLIVGETARLECDIQTAQVTISGEVRGNISAKNRIDILSPGRVYGNMTAPIVTIGEGVLFEGSCHMQRKTAEEDRKVAVLHNEKNP